MNNPNTTQTQAWWVSVLAGVGVAFLSYCAFVYFTRAELGQRGPESMPRLLVMLYYIGGRWGVLFIGGAIGVLAVVGGLKQLIDTRKIAKQAGETFVVETHGDSTQVSVTDASLNFQTDTSSTTDS